MKQKLAEAGALDALEELLGDDLVGVNVEAIERRRDSGMFAERFHDYFALAPELRNFHPRTSTKCPAMAAAAAIAGLTR